MLKQRSKLQLLIFLCMYSVKAVSAPSPGSIPPELHACWWQLGPLIHNQRLCLISFRLLGEFLLSESIIRVDRMMKFNEHLLYMLLLVLLFPESTLLPSSGSESEAGMYGMFSILPSSIYCVWAWPQSVVKQLHISLGCLCRCCLLMCVCTFLLHCIESSEYWKKWWGRWERPILLLVKLCEASQKTKKSAFWINETSLRNRRIVICFFLQGSAIYVLRFCHQPLIAARWDK